MAPSHGSLSLPALQLGHQGSLYKGYIQEPHALQENSLHDLAKSDTSGFVCPSLYDSQGNSLCIGENVAVKPNFPELGATGGFVFGVPLNAIHKGLAFQHTGMFKHTNLAGCKHGDWNACA